MFWEGIFYIVQLNKLFLKYMGGPEKGRQVKDPPTEEAAAAVEAVL